MKDNCRNFSLSKWQDTRKPWLILIIVTIGLTCIAHFLFQEYLFMKPCEQCVYIRFDMLVMAIGGMIALINPANNIIKIFSYSLAFCRRKNKISIWKNKTSIKVEILFFYKP